ncbi:hypothetical protein NT6N_35730 [Oceaniferula spumae]|uniref:tRNA(Ile)-lysidine synthase n=1 Tax=Oceaniferula spumae TaxID=2979115 RepID=A0AAT9FRG4_9BACT
MTLPLHSEFLALSQRRRYLLAISGGRDSVALLHALFDHGYSNLVLCHLNHALRGAESGKDAAFVRRLAKKFGLPCEIKRVDVGKIAVQKGESIELAARNARHEFFAECAKSYRCPRVLLAHHADDQAETIMFNLLRGSSGLKGMQLRSEHRVEGRKLEFIRPLLETPRNEIDAYLASSGIRYREDASNAEAFAVRNRLRNEALPLLTEIMGRDIRPALVRAASISSANDQACNEILLSMELEDKQGRLFLPKLLKLPPALLNMAVHDYLKKHAVPQISSDVLARCVNLLEDGAAAKTNLPGGRFFRRKEKRLFID